MSIGQRIAQKRKELGLSQEALGDRLGVSRQSIYKWESNTALPEIEKLIALSALFGVSVGWLLGVEEAAPEAPADTSELTEAQLNMVEEIVNRYLAAQPAPPKRRRWPWVLAVAVLIFVLVSLFSRLDQVDQQYNSLQNSVNNVMYSVNSQIGGISNRVEEILKAQNNLTADYSTAMLATDYAANTAAFSLRAVPKTYTEGMTAVFLADCGSGPAEFPAELGPGREFSCEVTTTLTNNITLSVVFISPDGTRQTQLLDVYEGLYSRSFPSIDVHDSLMWKEVSADGTLTLSQADRYVYTRPYGEAEGVAAVSDVRVGLFKNQKLVAWAEPCAQPSNYHGFEDCAFYLLPAAEVPLTAEDLIQTAALVTDEYGRTIMAVSPPYCLDSEDARLTRVSGTLDSDPTNWQFS